MNINGKPTRTILPSSDGQAVDIIDQTQLPHRLAFLRLRTLAETAHAIASMQVRGAPLIGATAAFGVALALREGVALEAACQTLAATRPTAVNLAWALARMQAHLQALPPAAQGEAAWQEAVRIADEDAAQNRRLGEHGAALLNEARRPGKARLDVMTHCNAGWLATVDYGTALSPVYVAHEAGLRVHVWVSETRPRNQGLLTAWELEQHGIPYTVIADNAAGLLLQRGEVDAVIVGADRIAANGDVANKVGTYLKALAAQAAGVPFFVAAPRSTIDFACPAGSAIPIEERHGDELRLCLGLDGAQQLASVRQLPSASAVANPAFDVTPAALVRAIVTERGHCPASGEGLAALYPKSRP
jgi:methylthioribose-1-phosphate isomerase